MKALSNRLNFWTQLIIGFLLAAILIAVPTGYEGALIYTESEKCKAEVISTDESSIISTGLIQSGEQICQLELLDGKFKGEKVSGINLLSGSLENDKIYSAGDEALVVVSYNDGGITSVTMTDHYRRNNTCAYVCHPAHTFCRQKRYVCGPVICYNGSYDMENTCSMLSERHESYVGGNGHHGSVDCRNNISCIRR